jgi:hypothetical protein
LIKKKLSNPEFYKTEALSIWKNFKNLFGNDSGTNHLPSDLQKNIIGFGSSLSNPSLFDDPETKTKAYRHANSLMKISRPRHRIGRIIQQLFPRL